MKVPVQKGKIDSNPMTSKQMNHSEKLAERSSELKAIRRGQTMELKTPKK